MAEEQPNITQEQAEQILAAESLDEKKRLAREFGIPEDKINKAAQQAPVPQEEQGGFEQDEKGILDASMADPEPAEQEPVEGFDIESIKRSAVPELGTGNDAMDAEFGAKLAIMRSLGQEDKFFEQLEGSMEQVRQARDVRALMDSSRAHVLQQIAQSTGMIAANPDTYPEGAELSSGAIRDIYERAMARGIGLEESVALALGAVAETDAAFERQAIAREFALSVVASIAPEGLGKWARDIGLLMVVPDALWDQSQIGEIGLLGTLTGDFSDLITGYQALSAEEKIKMFPALAQEVLAKQDQNNLKAVDILLRFLDPDMTDVNPFDVAGDVATIAPILGSIVSKAASGGRLLRFMRDMNRADAAGRLNAAAMRGDAVAQKAANTDAATAAQNAMPWTNEDIIAGTADGLDATTQAGILERGARVEAELTATNDILRVSGVTESERATVAARAWDDIQTRIANSDEGLMATDARFIEEVDGVTVEFNVFDAAKLAWGRHRAIPKRGLIGRLQNLGSSRYRVGDTNIFINKKSKDAWEIRVGDGFENSRVIETRNSRGGAVNWMHDNRELLEDAGAIRGITDDALVSTNRQKVFYTSSDIGEFTQAKPNVFGPWRRFAISAQGKFDNLFNNIVEQATILDFQSRKAAKRLGGAYREAWKGISKEDQAAVEAVLMKGSRERAVYSPYRLMNDGVNVGDQTIRLSRSQASAYYSVRRVMDAFGDMKNLQTRRQLVFENWKSFDLQAGDSVQPVIAKRVDLKDAKLRQEVNEAGYVLDTTTQVPSGVPIRSLEGAIKNGEVEILRVRGRAQNGDEFYDFVAAKPNSLKELPGNVIRRDPGYLPRLRKNVNWVLKQFTPKKVNGRMVDEPSETGEAIALFDRKAEGLAKLERMRDREGVSFKLVRASELQVKELEDIELMSHGGLYTGHRSSRNLDEFFGVDEAEGLRMDAKDSIERALGHISSQFPRTQWAAVMQQRFLNTYRQALTDPNDWQSPIKANVSPDLRDTVEDVRTFLKQQFRMLTDKEKRWAGRMEAFAANYLEGNRFLDPTSGPNFRKWFMEATREDPFSIVRATTFHALLGMFSPSQFFVQGMGAVIAFSLHPTKAPKLLNRYLAVRAMINIKDPAVLSKMAKESPLAKIAGLNSDEFFDMVRALQKSGLFDSIDTQADFARASAGIKATGNMWEVSTDLMKGFADKGLMFYAEGERLTRGYAWLTAFDKWIEANRGAKITDNVIEEITSDSLALSLNLNRANRSLWQQGILSIPTQFWQIWAKFAEQFLPWFFPGVARKFTNAEVVKVLSMHALLFGSAGIPMGTYMKNGAMGLIQGGDFEQVPEVAGQEIPDGIVEGLSQLMFNQRFEVSGRFSMASGIQEQVERLTENHAEIPKAMLGAFGSVSDRAMKAFSGVLPMIVNTEEVDWTQEDMVSALSGFGEIASSYRNAHKAYLWHRLQYVTDRSGALLFPVDARIEEGKLRGDDWSLLIGQALGFTPSEIPELYDAQQYVNEIREIEDEVYDLMRQQTLNYLAGDITDERRKRSYMAKLRILDIELTPDQKLRLRKRLTRDFNGKDDVATRVMRRAINTVIRTEEYQPAPLFLEDVRANDLLKANGLVPEEEPE